MDLTWAKKQTALWPFPAYAKVPRIPASGDFWSTILRCGKGRGMRAHWKWQGLQKQKDLFRKEATSGNLTFWDICKETRVRLFLLDSYTLSKKSWTCRKCSFNEVLWRLKEVEGAVFSVWEGLQDSLLSYSRVQSLYVCARVYTHINTGICFRACPS